MKYDGVTVTLKTVVQNLLRLMVDAGKVSSFAARW